MLAVWLLLLTAGIALLAGTGLRINLSGSLPGESLAGHWWRYGTDWGLYLAWTEPADQAETCWGEHAGEAWPECHRLWKTGWARCHCLYAAVPSRCRLRVAPLVHW